MARPRGSDQSVRRTRRVAGQRRVAAPPADYAAPPAAPSRFGSARPDASTTPVIAPPRPEQPGPAGPGWRTRLAGLRPRLPERLRGSGRFAAFRDPQALGIALIAIIVVLGTLTGLYLQGYLHARAVADARQQAVQAASLGVPRFAAYDYRHFDADVKATGKYLTADYGKQYTDFQNKAVRTTALKYKASITAEIAKAANGSLEVGVVSGSTGKVRLIVFLNQTTINTKLAAPKIAQSRLRVDMRKVGGHWLIAQITAF
jgi:Mce-associated membrane protein